MSGLSHEERAIFAWQLDIPGFGEAGQERLRAAAALVSRCGGLGGPLALHLVGAGFGRLVVAHGGDLKESDLNRQVLMTHDWVGRPRIESVVRRLRAYGPLVEVEGVGENVTEANVAALVSRADIVFDCAPLFGERFLLNRECVRQGKPMVEAAMFGLEGQLTTILPGRTPCLRCLYPEDPPAWKRRFPVLGAVSAAVAALAAIEGIKVVAGMRPALAGTLLYLDTGAMAFHRLPARRRPDCDVCGHLPAAEPEPTSPPEASP